jgi:hypothetical protein
MAMSAWRKTCLGREIPADSWTGDCGDSILRVLHGHRWNPFNADDEPLPVESLRNTTGFSMAEVLTALGLLERDGMVELTSHQSPYGALVKAARLTRKGGDDTALRIAAFGDTTR